MSSRRRRAELLEWASKVGANGIRDAVVATLARGVGGRTNDAAGDAEIGSKSGEFVNDSAGWGFQSEAETDEPHAAPDVFDRKPQRFRGLRVGGYNNN